MKIKSVGEALKDARKKAGLTQKEVCEEFGIKQSTYSAYECDRSEPDTETFLKLLRFFDVPDFLEAMGYDGYNEDGTPRLNMFEWDLIENYRKLNKYNRETVDILVERMVTGFADAIRTVERPLYLLPASAGTGQFLDSGNYEMVDFPEDVVPSDSTFAVRVSGDSMEPEFPDGSIVFVKQAKTLNVGDIGIFVLNDEGYIKRLGKMGRLISLNPKYQPIEPGRFEDIRIIGKVVGSYKEPTE